MSAKTPKEFYRHCPRCGSSAFIPSGVNRISCSSCQFDWYFNTAAAVDVILYNANAEILCTRRRLPPNVGSLDLPGGFVDIGESLESCARRELWEELGIRVEKLQYMASFANEYAFGGVIYYATDIIFTAAFDSTSSLATGDDVASAEFIATDKIRLEDVGLKSTRAAIAFYRDLQR